MPERALRPPELTGEHLFEQLVETAPDATVIVDEAGRIVLVNAQAELVFGYPREALLGEPIETLLPSHLAQHHRKLRNGFLRSATRRPMGGSAAELQGRRADGTEFPVEISLSPLQTPDGILVSAAVRDLTDRRLAERRFQDLLEGAPDGKVIVDAAGLIVLVNVETERIFGYDRTELLGQPIEMLVPERDREQHQLFRAAFHELPSRRAMAPGRQLNALRKDGTEFPAEITLAPLTTADGVLVSAAVRDVSERVALQSQADRIKAEFLATVSHELRTPLTSVIGYTEMLDDLPGGHLSDLARSFLHVITRSAQRELRLVDDLLTLVAMDDEAFRVTRESVDVRELVSAVMEEVALDARTRGLTLSLDYDAGPHWELDPTRIAQALASLLNNAIKFSLPGGAVSVTVTDRDGQLQIDVHDTGPGVPEAERDKIFERLFRGEDAVQGEVPGAGLGLPIARAIVEAHGGTLALLDVDHGSTFRVLLPGVTPSDLGS